MPLPRVAIVGRPNVGTSSLLNRLVGRRVSIVEPTAGVTRDRVAVTAVYGNRRFELVDTGGLGLVDEALLKEHIERQIEIALHTADVVLFVVDAKEGLVPGDQMVAERLRRLGKTTLLVVNKTESRRDEYSAGEWSRLGFSEPFSLSALEGTGVTVLLDKIVAVLPGRTEAEDDDGSDALKFAIVGKRNSGKSTLTNMLVGEERVIVSEIPGTTRDAVDVLFDHKCQDGQVRRMLAIDTAGVRKKKSLHDAIEFFSYSRATDAIRRSDVVVLLFDVTQEISEVDQKIANYVVDHHKPVLIVGNKVDLIDEVQLGKWDKYVRDRLQGLHFAPITFIAAKDGFNVDATLDLLFELRDQARTEIGTPELNAMLQGAKARLMPRSKGKQPKLFYGTQIGKQPLSILVFVNEPPLFRGQYDRYLQNCLRERFDCAEVPIRLVFRRREKIELEPKK